MSVQLTLITVNFNNARATVDLLRTLEKQTFRDFDVMVVDNDSAPADRAILGSYGVSSPLRLDIIYSDRNRGFSGGNNLAIRKALAQGSDWLCIINNDTTVSQDFIASLLPQLPPEPAIVGIPLRVGEHVAYAGIVKWLRPTLLHVYDIEKPITGSTQPLYAIGAGMLVHRDVFEKVGLLDEPYFLYFEDVDFSVRARHAGIPIAFLREPVIFHRESETSKKLGHPLLVHYHARNALRFNWRNGPWWVRALVIPAVCYGVALQSVKLILRRHIAESRATREGILDFVFGRWGRIPTERTIAIECESIEDTSWGVARMIRGMLGELAQRDDMSGRFIFDLYFKARVPDEPWMYRPFIRTHVVRPPSWLPVPLSFSLYYYVLLPLRLWWRRPALTYWPNYMLPLIAPQPSVVMLTEDIWHEMRNPRYPLRYKAAYRVFATWASMFATRVMAISHTSKQKLHRLFRIPLTRITVNELAVDAPLTSVAPMPGPYLLFVGQALERRHLRESIVAFARIAQRYPDLRFVAIGPDRYNPPCIDNLMATYNRALKRPVFQRIERVSDDDLHRFYAGARAIIYVSDIEAFGLPPLEALSYGVPVVVAESPLTREIYGEHAFVAASCDTTDIAEAMERAISDEVARARIIAAAPAIVARYSWKAHGDRVIALFDEMTQPSR